MIIRQYKECPIAKILSICITWFSDNKHNSILLCYTITYVFNMVQYRLNAIHHDLKFIYYIIYLRI